MEERQPQEGAGVAEVAIPEMEAAPAVEIAWRRPTKEALLDPAAPDEEVVVRFPEAGWEFVLRRIRDITDYREIAMQAEGLQRLRLKDKEGKEFQIDEVTAYRLALLSFSLSEPKMAPREVLEAGRVHGAIFSALANQAMLLNAAGGAEVEVLKNA